MERQKKKKYYKDHSEHMINFQKAYYKDHTQVSKRLIWKNNLLVKAIFKIIKSSWKISLIYALFKKYDANTDILMIS